LKLIFSICANWGAILGIIRLNINVMLLNYS
jgi:hypothetical protein